MEVLVVLRLGGAGLLAGLGGVHLDLWLTGYRHIGTIDQLFLVQVVASFVLAAAVAVTRHWYVAAGGALFSVGTLAGYELFRAATLFGFHEVRTTAGFTAGALEALAFVSLGGYALLVQQRDAGASSRRAPIERIMAGRYARAAVAWAIVAVALVAVVGVTAVPARKNAPPSGPAAGTTVVIKNFAFVPARFTVTPGEVVRVVNEDGVGHTLTALPGSSPRGAFDTGVIAPGGSATFVAPAAAGSYRYECTIHTFMTGVLTVS